MKLLARIALCLALITSAASASDAEMLAKETTVNALIENGWKLHTVSSSDYIITYTLFSTMTGEVVTCKVDSKFRTKCFKP
jgi:hypothetical protein